MSYPVEVSENCVVWVETPELAAWLADTLMDLHDELEEVEGA